MADQDRHLPERQDSDTKGEAEHGGPSKPIANSGALSAEQPPYIVQAPGPIGHASSGPIQVAMQFWQAPYPSPEAAQAFETILPGSFDRLLRMAERGQDAQIGTAKTAQAFLHSDIRRAHFLGAGISVVAMAMAGLCVWLRQPWVAAACLGVPVLSVAKAFVDSTGRSSSAPADPERLDRPPQTKQD